MIPATSHIDLRCPERSASPAAVSVYGVLMVRESRRGPAPNLMGHVSDWSIVGQKLYRHLIASSSCKVAILDFVIWRF